MSPPGPFNFEATKANESLPQLHLNLYSWSKNLLAMHPKETTKEGLGYYTWHHVRNDLFTTLLPIGVGLSVFSILINSVKKEEVLVQVFAFISLMYMCICTYYSLFKIGMLIFYSLTPWQTSPVNLLMICSMVARYAPPISYNFLNLISLGGKETIFKKSGLGLNKDARLGNKLSH